MSNGEDFLIPPEAMSQVPPPMSIAAPGMGKRPDSNAISDILSSFDRSGSAQNPGTLPSIEGKTPTVNMDPLVNEGVQRALSTGKVGPSSGISTSSLLFEMIGSPDELRAMFKCIQMLQEGQSVILIPTNHIKFRILDCISIPKLTESEKAPGSSVKITIP